MRVSKLYHPKFPMKMKSEASKRYNFDRLKPHFYIVELVFTWVCIIVLVSAQKHIVSTRYYRLVERL